jgi:hypothetical protein
MEEQMFPECGFPMDEGNESQPVCPRCGADPVDHRDSTGHLALAFPNLGFEETHGMSRDRPVITPGNNLIH